MKMQHAKQAEEQTPTSPWTEVFQTAQDSQAKQQENRPAERSAHATDSEAYRPTRDALSAIFNQR